LKALKIFLLLFTAGLIPFEGNSQQILNGGFEEIYYPSVSNPDMEFPASWQFSYAIPCGVHLGSLTNNSHSGDWAAKLETMTCFSHMFFQNLITILETTGNHVPIPGHPVNDIPSQLSFFYKFQPVGGDTAACTVLLYNLPDSIPFWDHPMLYADTVGFSEVYFTDQITEYTEMLIDLEYFMAEPFQYIMIAFSSYTRTIGNNEVLPQQAHAGTTLWIDDVELIYLPTSSENQLPTPDIQIFPNPVFGHFQMDVPDKTNIQSVVVFDNYGRVVRTLNPQDRFHPMNNLAPGIYFVRIETENGSVVKKLVKE